MKTLAPILDELVALFNAAKLDLPDGAIAQDCVFRLNGRAYHEQLGRPANDPLVRLIGRGAAGYRFIVTGLRYALADARLSVVPGSLVEEGSDPQVQLTARATLHGRLRGGTTAWAAECAVCLMSATGGGLSELAITMGDADVEQLLAARRS